RRSHHSAAAQPVLENFIPLRRRVHRTDTIKESIQKAVMYLNEGLSLFNGNISPRQLKDALPALRMSDGLPE
ncbi:MAG: hypothetical protein JXR76_00765, partial [Deltaproteobacteria bacterium]|nr:hypothetical protein [Deltaproteobacteria bacterium]